MKGDFSLQNFTLQPLFQDIMSGESAFSHITFEHIYRNREADQLSKVGVALERGSWKITESIQGHTSEYIHDL